jgi:RNA polymerase sigma-70 factor (ECF subfamily)
MTQTEEALVRSAQDGDRAAFEELVHRTSQLLFARLYLETGDTHRAEDLVQETLLQAFRSMGRLDKPEAFRSWLLKIAQNVAIDAARRDLRRKRSVPQANEPINLETLSDKSNQPNENAARQEMRNNVLAILRSIPEEYRLPLTLRYITGADYETICMQLGLTNGSLRGLLHRGLRLLRSRLPAEFGE